MVKLDVVVQFLFPFMICQPNIYRGRMGVYYTGLTIISLNIPFLESKTFLFDRYYL